VPDEGILERLDATQRVIYNSLQLQPSVAQAFLKVTRAKDAELRAKDAELKAKDAELKAKDAELKAEITAKDAAKNAFISVSTLLKYVHTVLRQIFTIDGALNTFAALSQAEGTVASTVAAAKERKIYEVIRANVDKEADKVPTKVNPHRAIQNLISDLPPLTGPFTARDLMEADAPVDLKRLNKVFQGVIANAEFLKRKKSDESMTTFKEGYSKKITGTTEKLRNFSEIQSSSEQQSKSEFKFPGPTCQEVMGVQEIFDALLDALAECRRKTTEAGVKQESRAETSPPKTNIRREVVVEATIARKHRLGDFAIWKDSQYHDIMRDDVPRSILEVKPGQRTGNGVIEMGREARDQSLSHMAKSVYAGFNFGGGVDTHSTGVAATLAHVEVLRLKLEGMGKPTAALTLESTGPLPLMTEKNYESWFESDVRFEGEVSLMREQLYPKTSKGIDQKVDKDGIPLGIKALWLLTAARQQHLFGPIWEEVSPHLGILLGTGAFGLAYQYLSKGAAASDEVIKVSRFGRRKYLENEVRALQQLGSERISYVPTLVKSGWLSITIGGLKTKLPAVVTKPLGKTLITCLASLLPNRRRQLILEVVGKDIKAALDFIHEKKWSHNDVSTKNIVLVTKPGQEGESAVLIDFGIASVLGEGLVGFRGTTEFIHGEIHRKHLNWYPCPEHDLTSLGFTMAALVNKGRVPWKGFSDRPVACKEMLAKRRKIALQELENEKPRLEGIDEWKGWIEKDKDDWIVSCGCQKGCRSTRCRCKRKKRNCWTGCQCVSSRDCSSDKECQNQKNAQEAFSSPAGATASAPFDTEFDL
jgi:tRNA A-37 threonylcarbamoyl transferase component Bud32